MTGDDLSRADVIVKGGLAVGALYGLGAISPYAHEALAIVGESDIDTLNFLLPFEYLQAGLYERGMEERTTLGRKMKLSSPRKALVEALVGEERLHIEALTAMIKKLGGKPVAKGKYAFAFTAAGGLFGIAANLERSAIGAYNGAIPLIESEEARMLANSIVQVEGRHAAAVRIQAYARPAQEAFDLPYTPVEALTSVEKYTGPAIYKQKSSKEG